MKNKPLSPSIRLRALRYACTAVLLAAVTLVLPAQEVSKPHFGAPFDFPLALSGNFGELRAGHFHGGVDFKTQESIGHPIHCVADGYISRVTVSGGGYGNGMYITHTNGYTTVYGHLSAFLPQIAERIRQYQYDHETYTVDLEFGPGEYPVTEGDIVALSGNTGYSFGPHLHMEVRVTATDEPVDPLLFYKDRVADDVPPRASSVMLYPQPGRGVVNGTAGKLFMDVRNGSVQAPSITAWGKVGAAIAAYDYMTGTHNYYGVQSVRLYVDDKLISESQVGRFEFGENRMLDSWIDYEERMRTGAWYMRSTIAPGNPLRMLKAMNGDYGWVTINEERDYRFRYELRDIYGNLSTYRFTVHGSRHDLSAPLPDYLFYMRAGQPHTLSWRDLTLWLPQDALYEDLQLDFEATDGRWQFCSVPTPLKENAELRLQVPQPLVADKSKYCIAEVNGGSLSCLGGTYDYGWLKTTVSRLSTYTIMVDTIAPRVTPHQQAAWTASGEVSFKLGDWGSGVSSYRGTIDGVWRLFRFSSKDMRLWCNLAEEGISRGHHVAEITVTDGCGNATTRVEEFDW